MVGSASMYQAYPTVAANLEAIPLSAAKISYEDVECNFSQNPLSRTAHCCSVTMTMTLFSLQLRHTTDYTDYEAPLSTAQYFEEDHDMSEDVVDELTDAMSVLHHGESAMEYKTSKRGHGGYDEQQANKRNKLVHSTNGNPSLYEKRYGYLMTERTIQSRLETIGCVRELHGSEVSSIVDKHLPLSFYCTNTHMVEHCSQMALHAAIEKVDSIISNGGWASYLQEARNVLMHAYNGNPKTCHKCSSTEHLIKDCPKAEVKKKNAKDQYKNRKDRKEKKGVAASSGSNKSQLLVAQSLSDMSAKVNGAIDAKIEKIEDAVIEAVEEAVINIAPERLAPAHYQEIALQRHQQRVYAINQYADVKERFDVQAVTAKQLADHMTCCEECTLTGVHIDRFMELDPHESAVLDEMHKLTMSPSPYYDVPDRTEFWDSQRYERYEKRWQEAKDRRDAEFLEEVARINHLKVNNVEEMLKQIDHIKWLTLYHNYRAKWSFAKSVAVWVGIFSLMYIFSLLISAGTDHFCTTCSPSYVDNVYYVTFQSAVLFSILITALLSFRSHQRIHYRARFKGWQCDPNSPIISDLRADSISVSELKHPEFAAVYEYQMHYPFLLGGSYVKHTRDCKVSISVLAQSGIAKVLSLTEDTAAAKLIIHGHCERIMKININKFETLAYKHRVQDSVEILYLMYLVMHQKHSWQAFRLA